MKQVAAQLAYRYGLRFDESNLDLLERGLDRLAQSLSITVAGLCQKLCGRQSTESLWQQVIEHVTVHETYLFRHPEQFELLGQRLTAQRLASGQHTLRAWSAGCSTGEEAYSIASTLFHHAPGTEISVLGTDVSVSALTVAEQGKYGSHSVRQPIPASLTCDFPAAAGGGVEVAPHLRLLVQWRPINLTESDHLPALAGISGGFDFIFCRNVLVYFTKEHSHRVLLALRDRLLPGGYLFLTALDQRENIDGLELLHLDGVPVLRRIDPPRLAAVPAQKALPAPPPLRVLPAFDLAAAADSGRDKTAEVKAAADQGDLDLAAQLARRLLQIERTPLALHLVAMILVEQRKTAEAEQLLQEALRHQPDYVLGHLSAGLLERPPHQKWRNVQHLHTVVSLLSHRPDDEMLHGPEPLQVAMARKLAFAGLANMGRRS